MLNVNHLGTSSTVTAFRVSSSGPPYLRKGHEKVQANDIILCGNDNICAKDMKTIRRTINIHQINAYFRYILYQIKTIVVC